MDSNSRLRRAYQVTLHRHLFARHHQYRPDDAGHPGLRNLHLPVGSAQPAGTIRFIQNGSAGNQGTGVIRKVATGTIASPSLRSPQPGRSVRPGPMSPPIATQPLVPFVASTTGAWTSGVEDTNDNGIVANSVAFTGSFVAIDPVTGARYRDPFRHRRRHHQLQFLSCFIQGTDHAGYRSLFPRQPRSHC